VWALYREGCATEVSSTRARVATVGAGDVVLDRQLPAQAIGGALVDVAGTPVGVVVAADRAAVVTRQLQASIDALIRESPPGQPTGGGFPWKWVAGAGAAGVVAALVAGGGRDSRPPPTTGDLIITIPGG
jgi:hypothetical protein